MGNERVSVKEASRSGGAIGWAAVGETVTQPGLARVRASLYAYAHDSAAS